MWRECSTSEKLICTDTENFLCVPQLKNNGFPFSDRMKLYFFEKSCFVPLEDIFFPGSYVEMIFRFLRACLTGSTEKFSVKFCVSG